MKMRNSKNAKSIAACWGKDLGKDSRDWYAIKALSDDEAEIRIYDVIGWPFIEADQFVDDLGRIDASNINARINSPGGDVFDGTAIYNALLDHPADITVRIDGIALSIASLIAMAGKEVRIAKSAYLMIHNPWSFAVGDYNDFLEEADFLKRIATTLGTIYAEKTGKSVAEIGQLMDAETWYIGQEAIDAGFVTALTNQSSATARFDLSMYTHAPKLETNPNKRDLERVLMQDAGLTRAQARSMLQSGFDAIVTQDTDVKDCILAAKQFHESMEHNDG